MNRSNLECPQTPFMSTNQDHFFNLLRDENQRLRKEILDLMFERDSLLEQVTNEQSIFYKSIRKEFV